MPCFDTGPAEYEAYMRERLHITTRLACEFLTELERCNYPIPEYAREWWRKHKIEDADRKQYEQQQEARRKIYEELCSKLTTEQLDAIKLNH